MNNIKSTSLSSQKRKHFTLIELLVVIAIIAILAAILFPVFGRARENARKSSCQSNLKQIGLGLLQYNQDYDEKFTPYENVPNGTVAVWHTMIQPYIKSTQLFSCPSNVSTVDARTSGARAHYVANGSYTTGRHTAMSFARPMDANDGSALSSIDAPAQCLLVSENKGGRTEGNSYSPSTAGGMDFTNHLATTNFLFVDGHVKALKPSATVTNNVNMWANDPTTAVHATLSAHLGSQTNAMN